MSSVRKYKYLCQIIIICWDIKVVLVDMQPCMDALIIFPSTYDGKIQWSTSGIENVADFCHLSHDSTRSHFVHT